MNTKWIQFTVEPQMALVFKEELLRLEEASRLESGCRYYAAFEDESAAGRFTVLESWEDLAALERHRAAAHTEQFKTACSAMIVDKSALSVKPLNRSLSPL